MNNNYNSNTVVKQDFAVVKQVDGRAALMADTTRHQTWQSTPPPPPPTRSCWVHPWFRIGLHATASKSSPRKALFSSVQEQSQHQPKDNFLEEHITYQVCLKLMKLK